MKAVILAGGLGTRISEETDVKPKPMVEIGGMPILWHIMKCYSHYGIDEFVICLGYKGYVIKEFFVNYFMHRANITIDLGNNTIQTLNTTSEPWKVTLIDTGNETMTGGRIKRIKPYIGDEPFMLTYGDGVSDINIADLLKFHKENGRLCTVTTVQPTGRFGAVTLCPNNGVASFAEKPKGDGLWISAGFFVCQPQVFDYIEGDMTVWEREPMERLAREGQMSAYRYEGFWKPMDTLKDKKDLNEMWNNGLAKWKIWE